jgi:hypothetical protein
VLIKFVITKKRQQLGKQKPQTVGMSSVGQNSDDLVENQYYSSENIYEGVTTDGDGANAMGVVALQAQGWEYTTLSTFLDSQDFG